jgi:hypothetical protein
MARDYETAVTPRQSPIRPEPSSPLRRCLVYLSHLQLSPPSRLDMSISVSPTSLLFYVQLSEPCALQYYVGDCFRVLHAHEILRLIIPALFDGLSQILTVDTTLKSYFVPWASCSMARIYQNLSALYSSFRIQFDPTLFGIDSREINPKYASSDWMLF